MMPSIIFDLDQTLVDTSISETLRKNRKWPAVYAMIPQFKLYEGMEEVLQRMRDKGMKICIVTTSPGVYAKKVLHHFNIPYDYLIDYFSVAQLKPHPESFHKAATLLKCDYNGIYSFGDRAIDIQASQASGITSVACTWGTNEIELLNSSRADHTIHHPPEILQLLNL